jgi:hypothetical protein
LGARIAGTEVFIDADAPTTGADRIDVDRLAKAFHIDLNPPTARKHTAKNPLRFSDPEELSMLLGGDFRRPRKLRAAVWSVASERAISDTIAPLRHSLQTNDTRWSYLDSSDASRKLREHGQPLIFAASVSGEGAAQGIFACARNLTIFCAAEIRPSVDYFIHCELIYVASAARRRGLAAVMTAAVSMCVQEDLSQLCRIWRRSGNGVAIRASISGDAYSPGGEQAFEALHGTASYVADMIEDVPLEVIADWSV